MNSYIKSYKEILGISKIRSEYFSKYASLLIQHAHLHKNSIFVDVPCGSGEMTKVIAKKNW